KRRTIKIAKRQFPTGISQIILQSEGQVLSERNLFINHREQLKVDLNSTSKAFSTRDSIPISIKVSDAGLTPVGGSFSVVVTDDNQVSKDGKTEENILSYFLLSSDLKGEIEDPAYYFHEFNEQKHDDLEALCLTQGWVNYEWDYTKKPKYELEKEYTISGKITNISNKPVSNASVRIFGRSKVLMFGDTTTNDKGEFVFRNLPPMDSATFLLKVVNSKGKLGTLGFEVNEFRQIPLKTIPVEKDAIEELDSIELNFIATKQQEYKANPLYAISLKEVVIVGKKVIKGSKNLNGPGEADLIITEETLEKAGKTTLLQVLQTHLPGINVGFRRKSYIRDYLLNADRIRLIIDGIDVSYGFELQGGNPIDESHYRHLKTYFDYYTAEDLNGIEVMRFTGKTILYKSQFELDSEGKPIGELSPENIVFIEVTTKSGAGPFLKKASNVYLVKPMNYGDVKTFYSPKYTSESKTDKKPDLRSTIYWAPNVVTNTKGEANFSFFSADSKGTYTVWIEGSDMQGKFGMQTMKLEIK
ncbi:MAG: carboxypeptidase regulatory-like domain-containing protein, partial [Bacteroidia bacterium]